jgi:GTP-binding protein
MAEGKIMVIKTVNLDIVIGITSQIPETELPEVAFAGKSNVGKSSLINAMMNRKSYARTSSQPGKTQTINYYNINDCMFLVDLPGYGYATASQAVKAKWGKMVEKYLKTSKQLRQVFLLIDIRHDPSENDKMMYDWIVANGYRPVIIATKLDKLKRSQIDKHVKAVKTGLGLKADDILIPFSSETKQGLDKLWEVVESYIYDQQKTEEVQ